MENIGQLTELVWGDKYQHEDVVIICASTERDIDGDYHFYAKDGWTVYLSHATVFAPEPEVEPEVEPEPEYIMPEVGDVIVWTSLLDFVDSPDGGYFKDTVRVELAEDQIGVVIEVADTGVMYPAITVRNLMQPEHKYLMKPEYTIVLKRGALK